MIQQHLIKLVWSDYFLRVSHVIEIRSETKFTFDMGPICPLWSLIWIQNSRVDSKLTKSHFHHIPAHIQILTVTNRHPILWSRGFIFWNVQNRVLRVVMHFDSLLAWCFVTVNREDFWFFRWRGLWHLYKTISFYFIINNLNYIILN